jgi:hypothetical protein
VISLFEITAVKQNVFETRINSVIKEGMIFSIPVGKRDTWPLPLLPCGRLVNKLQNGALSS